MALSRALTIKPYQKIWKRKSRRLKELEVLVPELESVVLGEMNTDKKQLTSSIANMKTALKEMSDREKVAKERMREFRRLVSRFKKLINTGQLEVRIERGRMVVALPSDLLFRSGSDRVSEEGAKTIRTVAKTLAGLSGKEFQIEGHTDNVPIKTARFPSNWELASARAINVVRIMISGGMSPSTLSAASYGPNKPVASNDNEKSRKQNRRIEIVVQPDLSLLPGAQELETLSNKGSI